MEAQEIYLDLVLRKKTITSNCIKNIYRLFFENGEHEIHFHREFFHNKTIIADE